MACPSVKTLLGAFAVLSVQAHAISRNSQKTSLEVSTNTSSTCSCDITARDDKAEFDQCNFWGDPHYTATRGSDPRFDYQGQGGYNIIFNNLCQLFNMQAFHCQYKSSRNAVTIGIKIQLPLPGTDPANPDFGYVFITKEKVTVSDTALFELVTGVPSWSDVDGTPGGEQEGTLSELQLKSGVGIQTEDGCNYVLINGKYISGKPGFILNVKARSEKSQSAPSGLCGVDPPSFAGTFVGAGMFTTQELGDLCEACYVTNNYGGDIPPGCSASLPPGAPAPPPPGPVALSNDCEWAREALESINAVHDVHGGNLEIKGDCDASTDIFNLRNVDGGKLQGFGNPTGVCVFNYDSAANENCHDVCEALGTECVNVDVTDTGGTTRQAGIINTNGVDCEHRGVTSHGTCTSVQLNSAACACRIPENTNAGQGPGPAVERQLQLDPTLGGLTEGGVRAACTEGDTNFLASAVYPPRTPDTHPGLDDEEYELDAILAGCIVDFVFADEGDRDSILDNVVEQDPAAPSTLCGDASIVNQADCLCGGTEVCGAGTVCIVDEPSVCQSPPAACGNTDGTASDGNDCTCGGAKVCSAAEVCDQGGAEPQCLVIPPCTNTDGTASLPSQCLCDNQVCEAGQACNTDGDGECLDVPDCTTGVTATALCRCGGTGATQVCEAGQGCLEGGGQEATRCVPNCDTQFCSEGTNRGVNVLCDDINGCTEATCCEVRCGDDGDVCDGVGLTQDVNQTTTECQTGCTPALCCQKTCVGHECGARTPRSSPDQIVCGAGDATCTNDQCCEEAVVPDPEPDTATCATFSSSCTLGDVNPSKTCAAATCTPDDCCDVSCSQGNPCSGAGLSPNAANAGQVCGTPTNTNGCSDGLCCVADDPAPTVPTCSTFPCHGLRWVPDPSKADVVCGPSGCNMETCCRFRRLRRRRHWSQNGGGSGYYSYYADESEETGFLQEAWCHQSEDCEDYEEYEDDAEL